MRYCSHCKVQIRGQNSNCPLCGNVLSLGEPKEEIVYPEIPPTYQSHLAIRIMLFISVTAAVSSFAVYMIFPTDVNWPLFVLFGLASMWLSLSVILRKKNNIPKIILWQVIIVSLLSLFWDWQTGWHFWSVDYVIPFIFVAAILVMYVTAKIMKLSVKDYIMYAFLDAVLGIIPVAFIAFQLVTVLYPSILCVASSIIFIAAIFLFHGGSMRDELDKRMHV
ncbi:MAG: DUF6320 domain-containing protein [Eubacteriales bacterium]|nr:DUF6320 domain-containing protein [Eubacteriales bacterium]MDD3349345.1 DUF6320 domain-containing protein [Eubacteriales bacterium]